MNFQTNNPAPGPAPTAPPQSSPASQPYPGAYQIPGGGSPIKYIVVGLAIVIIAACAFLLLKGGNAAPHITTTLYTTTMTQYTNTTKSNGIITLSGCGSLSSPGEYVLNSSIKTSITSGACILVNSSDVSLSCNGKDIEGSGPFDALPPFTYGIIASNRTNVSITGCSISNFSYGILAQSSTAFNLSFSNLSSNYVSNLYINNTSRSTVLSNKLSKTLSPEGSIYLEGNATQDLIQNNTIQYNQVFGINVSAWGVSFVHNIINSTPQVAFYCSVPYSYPISSSASDNNCFDNTGCGFISCKGSNLPADISAIELGSTVTGCGSITHPGVYQMASSIPMSSFIDLQNPLVLNSSNPCIKIDSSNVLLNCAGFEIYNATYPILVVGTVSNVTITNCRIGSSSGVGITLEAVYNSTISNTTITGTGGAIHMIDSLADNITNVTARFNNYGILMDGSKSNNLFHLTTDNNSYGVYMTNQSTGNNFYQFTALNSSRIDVFTSEDSAATQENLMSSSTCGTTDASWAPCKTYLSELGVYTPLTGCATIDNSGNYSLQNNIIGAPPTCFNIIHSDVELSCGGHLINSGEIQAGYGVIAQNVTNVSISNCQLNSFEGGVYVYRSKQVTINNVTTQGGRSGIVLNITNDSTIENSAVNTTTNVSIALINTFNSTVQNNNIDYGLLHTVGILVNNSRNNTIESNNLTKQYYGLEMVGASSNNLVQNNVASESASTDYVCNSDSMLGSELGGVNYGTTKIGCHWLAALQIVSQVPPCQGTIQPGTINLVSDYKYPYGAVCFSLSDNSTVINCNGHTIIATNGGTFASFSHASTSILENCYLVGFTKPVVALDSALNIYNNTILDNYSGAPTLSLAGGTYSTVQYNNITTTGIAILMNSYQNSNLKYNNIYNASIGYLISNSSGIVIYGNHAFPSAANSMVLNNTQFGQFQDNNLTGTASGLYCTGASASKSSISDFGDNMCSSQLGCTWLASSDSSC